MLFKRMKVERCYQFKELDFSVPPGLTALTGPNGCGKSNAVNCLYMGLTGEFPPDSGKDDFKHWDGEKGSKVQVWFSDRNYGEIAVTRNLDTGGHRMVVQKVPDPFTKKGEIQKFLGPLTGVDMAYADYLIFAPQGEFDNLQKLRHLERVKVLQALFGTARAETLADMLGSARSALSARENREEQIEALRKAQAETEAELARKRADLSALKAELDGLLPMYAQCRDIMLRTDTEAWTARERELTQRTVEPADITQAREELHALPTDAADPPDYATAEKAEGLPAAERRLAEARREADALAAEEVDALKAVDAMDAREPEMQAARAQDKALATTVRELEGTIRAGEAGVCDRCKRPWDISAEDLAAARAQLPGARKAQEGSAQMLAAYDRNRVQALSRLEGFAPRKAALSRVVRQLQVEHTAVKAAAEGFDRQAFDRQKAAYADARRVADRRTALLTAINAFDVRSAGAVSALVEHRRVRHATAAEKTTAGKVVAMLEDIRGRSGALTAETGRLEGVLEGAAQALAEAETAQEKYLAYRRTGEILDGARRLFHPEELPMDVVRGVSGGLNRLMLKYAEMFEFPYVIRLSDSLDYVVDHPLRKGARFKALSGAQRLIGSLIGRIAKLETFSFGCGLLVLDEPTAAMDARNSEIIIRVLSKVAEHFKERGISVIVPTHDNRIKALADHVVDISSAQKQ